VNHSRINVLGVGISALTLDSAVDSVLAAVAEGRQGYVTVTGVHGVSECQHDAELRRIHNESLLSTPDGVPLTWMGRLQGKRPHEMQRVYGPDLMLQLFERGQSQGLRHYLYGGDEGVAPLLAEKLSVRFPGVEIVGLTTPPFRPLSEAEELQFVTELRGLAPHCVWVGLSTPKQERFMAELLERHSTELPKPLVLLGVGAAFDFHAGLKPQAPSWMQRAGLEWFFRLRQEPRRLWRRYLKNNPVFVARAALQLTGLRKYDLPPHLRDAKLTASENRDEPAR
jgi:N-acetylglucosaminyldiphosphoundecaprenol N-acetyl-beta-D-mannosaminyltransferase